MQKIPSIIMSFFTDMSVLPNELMYTVIMEAETEFSHELNEDYFSTSLISLVQC